MPFLEKRHWVGGIKRGSIHFFAFWGSFIDSHFDLDLYLIQRLFGERDEFGHEGMSFLK